MEELSRAQLKDMSTETLADLRAHTLWEFPGDHFNHGIHGFFGYLTKKYESRKIRANSMAH
jgi:hypothetical protein